MKQSTLTLLLTLTLFSEMHAQPLDYSKYKNTYFDDFNYDTSSFKINHSFNFGGIDTPSGTRYGGWIKDNSNWGAENEYYYVKNLSMPDLSILRITENKLDSPFTVIMPDGNPRYCAYGSGTIRSRANFGFGIIEARIKFPKNDSEYIELPDSRQGSPAFWSGAEIDVFDVAFNHWLPHAVHDWTTDPSDAFYLTDNLWVTSIVTPGETITNLSDNFHIYSGEWTPSLVSFYIDGVFLSSIDYRTMRTIPFPYGIELALLASADNNTRSGQFMDIDWVKIWEPKCNDSDLSVSDITTSTFVQPGLYKYNHIESVQPIFMNQINPAQAYVFEANATTLLPTFQADETDIITGPYYSFATTATKIMNGYLLIRPSTCEKDPRKSSIPEEEIPVVRKSELMKWEQKTGTNNNSPAEGQAIGIKTEEQIDLQLNRNIDIYPNPAHDKLTIGFTCNGAAELQISITDISGRTRIRKTVNCNNSGNTQYDLNIKSLEKGMYIIEATLGNQHIIKKITKL